MAWQGFSERKFPRVKINLPVKISSAPSKIIKAQTKNIGCGGLCVFSQEPLMLFQEVEIHIGFPEIFLKEGLSVHGRVIWAIATSVEKDKQNYDVGIEFLALKKNDQKKIDQFVQEMLSREEE